MEKKNVFLNIHELSQRECKKSVGLRYFGALTMHHLEIVT